MDEKIYIYIYFLFSLKPINQKTNIFPHFLSNHGWKTHTTSLIYLEDESFYQARCPNPVGVKEQRISCCVRSLLKVKCLPIYSKVEVHSQGQIALAAEFLPIQALHSMGINSARSGAAWASLWAFLWIFFKARKSKFHIFIKQTKEELKLKLIHPIFVLFLPFWLS